MRLVEILREPLVLVGLRATTKAEAIDELIDLLVAQGEVTSADRAGVAKAIFDRERSRSTGMEHGVALPHGVVPGLADVTAALGISPAGIDFQSADGRPTHLVVLLAIPQNKLQVHVKTLAGVARLLNDEVLREGLRGAKTASAAMALIRDEEGEA